MPAGRKPKTVWYDSKYSATTYGTKLLNDILGTQRFNYPKSLYLVMDCLRFWMDSDATVADYFAGSGTTGHAVINLNREDGGERKFILVEMGEYFDTVLLPRIKKVTFSPEWKRRQAEAPRHAGGGRAVAPHRQVRPAGVLRGRAGRHRVRRGGGAHGPGTEHRRLPAQVHAEVGDEAERDAAQRGGADAAVRLPAARPRQRGDAGANGGRGRDLRLPAGAERPHAEGVRRRR